MSDQSKQEERAAMRSWLAGQVSYQPKTAQELRWIAENYPVRDIVLFAIAELARRAEERDALLALCVEMWDEQSRWSGPVASSHYRSDISARIKAIRLAKELR